MSQIELESLQTFSDRYGRQLLLPRWSVASQRLLAGQTFAIDPSLPSAALYLVGAGAKSVWLTEDAPQLLLTLQGLDPEAIVGIRSESVVADIVIQTSSSLSGRTLTLTVVQNPPAICIISAKKSTTLEVSSPYCSQLFLGCVAAMLTLQHLSSSAPSTVSSCST